MMDQHDGDIDYDAIRRRINRRIVMWGSLVMNFVLWIVGMSIISMVVPGHKGLIAAAWFGVIVLHATVLGMLAVRNAMLERAVRHARTSSYGMEKLKRAERLSLSDDGELVESGDEDFEPESPRQNHRVR